MRSLAFALYERDSRERIKEQMDRREQERERERERERRELCYEENEETEL